MSYYESTRVCKVCGEEKHMTCYYKVNTQHHRRKICIPCMKEVQKANYIKRKSLSKTKS